MDKSKSSIGTILLRPTIGILSLRIMYFNSTRARECLILSLSLSIINQVRRLYEG